jgi:predicted ATP-dependent endonuclease of OLD family
MRPVSFRIHDFKSISDSGVCKLSGDGITVLAGQNEAGKTAVLTALRDFDLEENQPPATKDYEPEEQPTADSRVSIEFDTFDIEAIREGLSEDKHQVPLTVLPFLHSHSVWITRTLKTGQFSFDEQVRSLWTQGAGSPADFPPGESATPLGADEFAAWLRDFWPAFVYFEAFQDSLPRQVDFAEVKKAVESERTGETQANSKVPSSVLDFVLMSDLDVDRVAALADNDKSLGNYLSHRGAAITGDFLTYWKQKVDKDETVDLRVRHLRDSAGTLKLAFYVHDKSDKYPDQRSKGFLWFLSFYLKLAATQKRYPTRRRILLIDEPGSYLHARAQRDVLHLLESRIATTDQVLYSTHSPYLIPPDRLHRLRIVRKKTATGTAVVDRLTHPDLRGAEFADSLSPVIAAIGIDISQSLNFKRQKNLFVEGISDYMYLTAWARILRPEIVDEFNIFPGSGATTIPMLASLFIGWGFDFVVLLDNDDQGQASRKRLENDLSVAPKHIVQPKNAKTIEDALSPENFDSLLSHLDKALTLNAGERPSAAIARLNIDKVLLARTYSEQATKIARTKKSEDSVRRLLGEIWEAWGNR